jgi:Rap/ran-GAP
MLITYCQAEVDFDSDAIRTGRKKLTQAELNTLASYMITQMYTPRNPPILLSDDEATLRSIRSLDRMPVVNYHSIGITYVGWGQKTEEEILSNEFGSLEYQNFLNVMGQFIPLKGNTGIYTGGLDTADDQDGTHALFWSDKTTQITFITYTMIPLNKNGDRNLALTNKKRNAANCFVNIIWNDSNDPYALDTISSEFNSNSIVISRHSRMSHESDFVVSGEINPRERQFFKVKLLQTKDMPPVSPILTEKIISDNSLAPFVRSVALKLSIFCQIYIGRQERSHWVARLEQIKRIRANALSKRESIDSTSTGRTILTPSPSTSRMSSISSTTTARKTPTPDVKLPDAKNDNWEEERLEEFLDKYDFTRYT